VNWKENYKPVRWASWEDLYDSVREAVTMDEAVALYAPEHAPRGRRIPCPIHHGKDYNLSYTDRGFRCFVCGASGDVISFVRDVCGLESRNAAITRLNRDFRLSLPIRCEIAPETQKALEARKNRIRERNEKLAQLQSAWHAAMDWFALLDRMKTDFAPADPEEEPCLQYAFACRRIAGAWYEAQLAASALRDFETREKVIPD